MTTPLAVFSFVCRVWRDPFRRRTPRGILAFALVTLALWPALAAAQTKLPATSADAPHLDYNLPVICAETSTGERLRLQCIEDEKGKHCLAARATLVNGGEELRMTNGCYDYWDAARYQADIDAGTVMTPAIAETPPGWARDQLGRTFQVTFDLLDRFYFGAGWEPRLLHDPVSSESLGRARFDMGFSASVYESYDQSRYDFRALEGSVSLTGLQLDGLLFAYDYSHNSREPALRITTFFGDPARHDLNFDIGWGLSLLEVRSHPNWEIAVTELEFGEIHVGWDLWKSDELYDHVRFKLGGGFGSLWQGDQVDAVLRLSPQAALDGRFGLGQSGLHYLTANVHGDMGYFVSGPASGQNVLTGGAKLAYEAIFIAINDQPLSLYTEASTEYWEGVDGLNQWSTSFMTGLRFSLWAPPLETNNDYNY